MVRCGEKIGRRFSFALRFSLFCCRSNISYSNIIFLDNCIIWLVFLLRAQFVLSFINERSRSISCVLLRLFFLVKTGVTLNDRCLAIAQIRGLPFTGLVKERRLVVCATSTLLLCRLWSICSVESLFFCKSTLFFTVAMILARFIQAEAYTLNHVRNGEAADNNTGNNKANQKDIAHHAANKAQQNPSNTAAHITTSSL